MTAWVFGAVGGLMIGCAAAMYLIVNGRIMGASGILGGLIDGSGHSSWPERVAFLIAMIAVPALMNLTRAQPATTGITDNFGLVLLAGLLVGLGTRIGGGCTSGHGVCGISRLSLRGIFATCCYMGAGMATVAIVRIMTAGGLQ